MISCPDCDRVFTHPLPLSRHRQAKHTTRPLVKCSMCDFTTQEPAALVKHEWAERTQSERFWARVEKAEGDGCWVWTGALNNPGGRRRDTYGRLRRMDKLIVAHRFAYEDVVGPVPEGLQLDHLCRNTTCVRPDHLEPVTHLENMRRGIASREQERLAAADHSETGA